MIFILRHNMYNVLQTTLNEIKFPNYQLKSFTHSTDSYVPVHVQFMCAMCVGEFFLREVPALRLP